MKKVITLASFSILFLTACGGNGENPETAGNGDTSTVDFSDMDEMSLQSEGLNMQIMLPNVASSTGASIEPTVEHFDGDYLWDVKIGNQFHLIIEDFGKEKNKVAEEKKRIEGLNKIFIVEYLIDEPAIIMYKRELHEGQGGKTTYHCYGETVIDGYTYVLRSHEDGNFKPIIEDMVKTIRSAKQIEKAS
ncbi:MAG: hypothetical protein HYZ14_16115 [Bacteroidetes bacterium]|nr:hypothetical protein [Bacteroidota bacterium]